MEYQRVITEDIEDSSWDDFVIQSPNGHFTQMALWTRVKAVQGWKTIRVVYWNGDQIVGGAQILWRNVQCNIRMGYVSKGPLITLDDPEFVKQVILDLQRIAKDYRLIYFAVQPPNDGHQIEALLPALNMNLNHQGDIEKPATMRINLTPEMDAILQNIQSKKKRRLIRYGIRSGFDIRDGTRDDLPTFFKLHQHTGQYNAFDVQSLEFFQTLWDAFAPLNMVHLFLCCCEGNCFNTFLSIPFHETLENYRCGWSGEYPKLYPNEAIIWYIIGWAKEHGYKWLDFGGLDLKIAQEYLKTGEIPEDKLDSYSARKLHYSGEVLIFPQTYEYIYRQDVRWGYDILNKNNTCYMVIKKGYQLIRHR